MVQTKDMSTLNFSAEGAALKPGHASAINESNEEGGNVYVDDFEGSTNGFDIRQPATNWVLASIPQMAASEKNELFPESKLIDDLNAGVNRAKLAWYRIDETVRANSADIDDYVAAIPQKELFPNRQIPTGFNPNIQTFDLHFEPKIRGPYNFDPPSGTPYSKGNIYRQHRHEAHNHLSCESPHFQLTHTGSFGNFGKFLVNYRSYRRK